MKEEEKIKSKEDFIRKFRELYPEKDYYDFSKMNYIDSSHVASNIYCTKHKEFFSAVPYNLVRGGIGCKACREELTRDKHSKEKCDRIEKALENNFPQYKLVPGSYNPSDRTIKLFCKIHNSEFTTKASSVFYAVEKKPKRCLCSLCDEDRVSRENLGRFMERLHKLFPHFSEIPGKTKYKNNSTDIWLHCDIHNVDFCSRPGNLLFGKSGCKLCTEEAKREFNRKINEKKFIKYINDNFPDIDCSKVVYINQTTKVTLICKKDGTEFEMNLVGIQKYIKDGYGICPCCRAKNKLEKRANNWKEKVEQVHPGKFDLSEAIYVRETVKVKNIKCKKCGEYFDMYPANLLYSKKGCPKCKGYFAENFVGDWLEEHSISFKDHVKHSKEEIRGREKNSGVEVDFELEYQGQRYWIECNGEQHYFWCKHFQETRKDFENQLRRDSNVRKYCKNNSILLIEIPWLIYGEKEISEVLERIILNSEDPTSVILQPPIQYVRRRERGCSLEIIIKHE